MHTIKLPMAVAALGLALGWMTAGTVRADSLSVSNGPYAGGNTVTITNGTFGAITNVTVGGVAATIQFSGSSWVTFTVPAVGSAGVKDIVIQTSDNGDTTLAGVYTVNPQGVIRGEPDALPALVTLTSSWLNGTNGNIFRGAGTDDMSGYSVSDAGDVNGDGFADLLVGAYNADPFGRSAAGETYLVFGRSTGLPALAMLTNTWLNGTNGVVFAGARADDYSGSSVSGAGDVNGDGFADLLVGAYYADPSGRSAAGETYLVYGRSNGYPATVTLTNTWLDGTNGVVFAGAAANGWCGQSVSGAGDVNGDGFADLLVGAPAAGEAYLVYGRSNGYPVTVTLTNTWLDGTNGVVFTGAAAGDYSGSSVSGAGDVNGDGFDDLLVGAYYADPSGRNSAGEAYLVYGRSNGYPATVTLTNTWLDGTNGVVFAGAAAGDNSGWSVSGAGDVNGDGFADLLVGAYYADPSGRSAAGETYLVYGRSNGYPATVTLTNTWLDGTNGVVFAGAAAGDYSGCSVSGAGDVNGDGFEDLLVGAYYASPSGRSSAGEAYLVYGRSNGYPATVTLTNTWLDGTNGIVFAGAAENDWCGRSVSGAGDANGDGLADLFIGANGGYIGGETYLAYAPRQPAIVPSSGSWTGGYPVAIAGTNLGNGGDITNVMLCGVAVTGIASQSATQVVVWAAMTTTPGLGDVRVFSTSYGETVKSNAFTCLGPDILVSGPAFGHVRIGQTLTNIFSVTNSGNTALSITAVTNNGAGAAYFNVSAFPSRVEAGTASNFPVVYTPGEIGAFNPVFYMVNDSPDPNHSFILSGASFQVSTHAGPYAGGNTITVTNDNFGAITNVRVCGANVVPVASGSNWFTIVLPAATNAETVSMTVQTSDNGATTLHNAYTYNPPGEIRCMGTTWEEMEGLPFAVYGHGAATYSGMVYVAGGYTALSNVYRFNGTSWEETAGLPEGRRNMPLCVYKGRLYGIGGTRPSAATASTLYEYDGSAWTTAAAMPAGRTAVGCAVLGEYLYAVGGYLSSARTNVYRFDGASWSEVAGLPAARENMGCATFNGRIYVVGGAAATNVYFFNGTNWAQAAGLPAAVNLSRAEVLGDRLYVFGGTTNKTYSFDGTSWRVEPSLPSARERNGGVVYDGQLLSIAGLSGSAQTNIYRLTQGISPRGGSCDGGYPVVISGSNLCDGSDITNVTLCGVSATNIASQSATQVVVWAGSCGSGATGDVAVFSTSYGITTKTGGFSYTGVTTHVVLYDFYLQAVNGGVSVCWQTASEEDTVGFDLFRREGDAWVKVNDALIPGMGELGGCYSVADPLANATDTFLYKLVEYETDGETQEYGHYDLSVRNPRLQHIAITPEGIVLRWLSREQDTYEVQRTQNLMSPLVPIATGLPATPPVNVYTDETETVNGAYYRIRVED